MGIGTDEKQSTWSTAILLGVLHHRKLCANLADWEFLLPVASGHSIIDHVIFDTARKCVSNVY